MMRLLAMALGLVALAILAPPAAAEPGAIAAPAVMYAGAPVVLTFTYGGGALAEATVEENVSCTIQTPDGAKEPCEARGTLVDVRVQGSERTYTYSLTAPAITGRYTATMVRASTVDAVLPPGEDGELQAVFDVVPEPITQAPDDSANGGGDITTAGTSPPPATTPQEGTLPAARPDRDAGSWLATLGMAALAMLGSIGLAWRGS